MKPLMLVIVLCFGGLTLFAQNEKKISPERIKREFAMNACKCVDSIDISKMSKTEVETAVAECIKKQITAYQLTDMLASIDLSKLAANKNKKDTINISLNLNENSNEYKKYYYKIEEYLLDSCPNIRSKISSDNKPNTNSLSQNKEAIEQYEAGQAETSKGNDAIAIIYYNKAVELDPKFAFAWDNLGLCYRKTNQYAKAIHAYEQSLKIDSSAAMPLQNLAVVYQYTKDYDKAIAAYEKMQRLDSQNAEGYYGLSRLYTISPIDYPKALDNMCKAYKLYVSQKSPFRSDALQVIQLIHSKMQDQGQLDKFKEILEQNNLK